MNPRKTKKRPGAEAPERCRKTMTLPLEQAEILAALAVRRGKSESELVSEALAAYFKGYYLAHRPGRPSGEQPPEEPRTLPLVG